MGFSSLSCHCAKSGKCIMAHELKKWDKSSLYLLLLHMAVIIKSESVWKPLLRLEKYLEFTTAHCPLTLPVHNYCGYFHSTPAWCKLPFCPCGNPLKMHCILMISLWSIFLSVLLGVALVDFVDSWSGSQALFLFSSISIWLFWQEIGAATIVCVVIDINAMQYQMVMWYIWWYMTFE